MSGQELLDDAIQIFEIYKDGVPLQCTIESIRVCAEDGTKCVFESVKTCTAVVKPLVGKIWGARINIPF